MNEPVPAQQIGGVRCGDTDRERTAERLRDAAGAGYLTMDELGERLTGAYAATHRQELDALVLDLPRATPSMTTAGTAVLAALWTRWRAGAAPLFGRPAVLAAVAVLALLGCAVVGFDLFEAIGFDD
jgi:Domain of unknown function (DUF1707)